MDKKYKILLPVFLTYSRLLFIPIILILTYFKFYNLSLIIIVLGFITDYLDNYLALKWNTTSLSDSKIDIIISKVFELILLFITGMYVILLLDILFIFINLIFYYKYQKINILEIGYIKEIIFLLVIFTSYINIFITNINFLNGFIYVCINIQIISLIKYFLYNINFKKNTIKNNLMHESIMNLKNLNDTIICE